jgi:hypothetical protein
MASRFRERRKSGRRTGGPQLTQRGVYKAPPGAPGSVAAAAAGGRPGPGSSRTAGRRRGRTAGSGRHGLAHAAGLEVGVGEPRVHDDALGRQPCGPEPPIKLQREVDVGQLGLPVGPPGIVASMEVGVVGVERPPGEPAEEREKAMVDRLLAATIDPQRGWATEVEICRPVVDRTRLAARPRPTRGRSGAGGVADGALRHRRPGAVLVGAGRADGGTGGGGGRPRRPGPRRCRRPRDADTSKPKVSPQVRRRTDWQLFRSWLQRDLKTGTRPSLLSQTA